MPTLLTDALLVAGGAGAGVLGTAGGITSLVSYPVLLAAGIGPFAANVTNSVALLGSGLGSAARSRPELRGHRETLRRWLPLIVAFSLVGAGLLVVTPGGVFAWIVPFLVAAGSLILLLQPRIAGWQERTGRRFQAGAVTVAGAVVAIYNGYFGAGSGILLIALLLLTTEPALHRANALKNVLLLAADAPPAVLFALHGSVVWRAVWPLAAGALLGGLVGPVIARRAPQRLLRVLIALCGLGLAGWLLVTA